MRAFLLASATASTLALRRLSNSFNQPLELVFLRIARIIEREPEVSSVRTYVSPRLLMLSRFVLPPLDRWRGTSPSQAATWRRLLKFFASPIVATSAVAVIVPIRGICSSRRLASFSRCQALIWASISASF